MGVFALPVVGLVLLSLAAADNSTVSDADTDVCGLEPPAPGPWAAALQAWALSSPAQHERHGRVMSLPPAPGYYVSDRVDRPPPPPPPGGFLPAPYDEWSPPAPPAAPAPPVPPAGGKIVNRPTGAPYKEKPFKPSPAYPAPPPNQIPPSNQNYQNYNPHRGPGPMPSYQQGPPPPYQQGPPPQQGPVDRVDEPPRKQVSETDLYLLGAIEKLVYRVDLMEKRLRKLEENVHYLVAGAEPKPEPCVANFTRVAGTCYHFSVTAVDWKTANLACRKLRANLLELDTGHERRNIISAMLADTKIKGMDVWTGGLNPGLLWIWAGSARPVAPNNTAAGPGGHAGPGTTGGTNATVTIVGDGRCLALVHDPAINYYVYRGQDCAFRHRYICEADEDKSKLSNHITRLSKQLHFTSHTARQARGGILQRIGEPRDSSHQ